MGRNDKNITISLRIDEDTKYKLDSLCQIENEYFKEIGHGWEQAINSKLIRCLIDVVYNMPEETKKELIVKYYRRW